MRLAHRICKSDPYDLLGYCAENNSPLLMQTVILAQASLAIGTARVIIADNVVEAFNDAKITGRLPAKWKDFPACPMPARCCFVDWEYPSYLVPSQTDWLQAGMMVHAFNLDDTSEEAQGAIERVRSSHDQYPAGYWLYCMTLYATSLQGNTGLLHAFDVLLDRDCTVIGTADRSLTQKQDVNWHMEFKTALLAIAFSSKFPLLNVTKTHAPTTEHVRGIPLNVAYYAMQLDHKVVDGCLRRVP